MSYLYEKVSYLKGLADGMNIKEDTNEGKLMINMIEVIEELALAVEDIQDDIEYIDETIDLIDEDLSEIEDAIYEDEDEFYDEFECPECGEQIIVNEDLFDEDCEVEVECPKCKEKFIVYNFECEDEYELEDFDGFEDDETEDLTE